MAGLLPPGVPEALLFLVLVTAGTIVVQAVRKRRNSFLATVVEERSTVEDLPSLQTHHRVTGTVRRAYRDPVQAVWLVEIQVGKRKITFAATDFGRKAGRYATLTGQDADIALYGLATLEPGGAEAMREQIKDYDKVKVTPDLVRLIPAGQFGNDHAVIGRILSRQEDSLSDSTPVTVYRTQVIRSDDLTLVLELATDRETTSTPLAEGSMAHGSARLFGYLADQI